MASKALVSSLSLLAAAAACAAPTAPAKPTWAEDVQPIIQGNCSHCHGATAALTGGGVGNRFDICKMEAFRDTGIKVMPDTTFSLLQGAGGALSSLIKNDLTGKDGGRPKMPPPPASELYEYERDVVLNWLASNNGAPDCGTRPGNRKPQVKVVSKPAYAAGDVSFTVDVTDPDGETVIGTINAEGRAPLGDDPVIDRSGRHRVTLKGVDDGAKITLKISDGSGAVDRGL